MALKIVQGQEAVQGRIVEVGGIFMIGLTITESGNKYAADDIPKKIENHYTKLTF